MRLKFAYIGNMAKWLAGRNNVCNGSIALSFIYSIILHYTMYRCGEADARGGGAAEEDKNGEQKCR